MERSNHVNFCEISQAEKGYIVSKVALFLEKNNRFMKCKFKLRIAYSTLAEDDPSPW